MFLLDSCVWIEYFADGALAGVYEDAYLGDLDRVLLSPLVVAEVLRWLSRAGVDEDQIDQALAAMLRARPVPLGIGEGVLAASLMTQEGLPFADALIYAHATATEAELVTQDGHFEGLAGVRFHEHPSRHPDPARRKRRRPPPLGR